MYSLKPCVCVRTRVFLVSLPKLKEIDWRVDMVTGSDCVSRLSVPTCLVQFKVSKDLSSSQVLNRCLILGDRCDLLK